MILKKLTHPVSDVEKALLICEIKQQKKAHGISEESCRQAPKPEVTERSLLLIIWPHVRVTYQWMGKSHWKLRTCPVHVPPFLSRCVPQLNMDSLAFSRYPVRTVGFIYLQNVERTGFAAKPSLNTTKPASESWKFILKIQTNGTMHLTKKENKNSAGSWHWASGITVNGVHGHGLLHQSSCLAHFLNIYLIGVCKPNKMLGELSLTWTLLSFSSTERSPPLIENLPGDAR